LLLAILLRLMLTTLLSLGSQQANAHVHWHIAPLPPGVPLQRQQFHQLMLENGVIPLVGGPSR
jgi:hypothetical protein